MHACIVEAYASSTLLYYTAGPLEEIPRIYDPLPVEVPKKKTQKSKVHM
jgi:hypothetical protein